MTKKNKPLPPPEREKIEARLKLFSRTMRAFAALRAERPLSNLEVRESVHLMLERDKIVLEIRLDNANIAAVVQARAKAAFKPKANRNAPKKAGTVVREVQLKTEKQVAVKMKGGLVHVAKNAPKSKKKQVAAKTRAKDLAEARVGARRSGGVGVYGLGNSVRRWS
jgi:hypothetical protein